MTRLYVYLIAAGGVLAGAWFLHHTGYKAGEAAAEARMADEVEKATDRAIKTEKAAEIDAQTREKANADKFADLDTRYRTVVSRYERLRVESVRQRAMPKTPATPRSGDGDIDAGGQLGGDGGLDRVLADTDRLSADADRLSRQFLAYGRSDEERRIALAALQSYGQAIDAFRAQVDVLNEPR